MNETLFQKTIDIARKTIDDAHLKPGDITDLIMVGGSSRIPRVRKRLQDFLKLPILDVNRQVDIQEAMAIGAAIQAGVLNGAVSTNQLPLSRDIQPFSVRIKTNTGKMYVLIKRNTKLPCEGSITLTYVQKNRNAISFDIYIGEERLAGDNLFLKTIKIEGIPPAPGDLQKITIQMKIDTNGVLNVNASTPGGPSSTLTIQDCSGRYTDEDLC
ncbi:unnamed protein product [Allacma fusca]|uniref:Heat shock protein 70 n=1 Tax=Allacma fusca TaxID=39272 RepID=A0A8J2KN16_9HEXA|nr:unnamed protein product [Allacma fusca]